MVKWPGYLTPGQIQLKTIDSRSKEATLLCPWDKMYQIDQNIRSNLLAYNPLLMKSAEVQAIILKQGRRKVSL